MRAVTPAGHEVEQTQAEPAEHSGRRPARRFRSEKRLTLSVEEVAEVMGIGRTLAYEAVRRGEIPSIRIGSRILVAKAALSRLLTFPSRQQGEHEA